jgi:hypothetical protein
MIGIIEEISHLFAGLIFAMNRRSLLKRIGCELLGEEFSRFAVLEPRDIEVFPRTGFMTDFLMGVLLGPIWGLLHWVAALRAYRALKTNRDLPVRIVAFTLTMKNVPAAVWDEFERRTPEAKKYRREYNR